MHFQWAADRVLGNLGGECRPRAPVDGPCPETAPGQFYLKTLAALAAWTLFFQGDDSYLVDSASSHMLVSKIKPCMSKYKQLYGETANGSLNQLSFI